MSHLRGVFAVLILGVVIDQINCETCTSGQCPKSVFNSNLAVSPDKDCYDSGDSVTLTCSGNIGGPQANSCGGGTFNGWTVPTATTCEVFTCAKPSSSDSNLNFSPDKTIYDAREALTYSCNQGYRLTGTAVTTCDGQDTWNPETVPVCVVACEVPTIANGQLTAPGPFNDGDTATVECDDGYDLESGSSSSITCQSDGQWDNVPQCFLQCNLPGVGNSDSTSDAPISHGGSKTISCLSGYSYNQQTTLTVNCDSGNLDKTVPTQCYRDCVARSAPNNGAVSGGNLHGESVTYSCNRGYLLNETETDTCDNGSWTEGGQVPTCYSKSLEDSITLYCNPDKYIVEIPGELLGDSPNVTSVTMGSCQGTVYDGSYLYINSTYNDCGTSIEVDEVEEKVYYRNLVTSSDTEVVTTEESLDINVECVFDQTNRVSSSAVMQNTLTKDLTNSGTYDISFVAYTDSGYTNVINDSVRVDTNDLIYLLAQVNYVADVDLFGSRCYATPSPETNYYLYYDLISDGCAVGSPEYASDISDDKVTNPNFAFALRVFRFTGSTSDSIYVHCDLKICKNGDCNVPADCSSSTGRRKRSTQISFSKHVFAGPIKMNRLGETENTSGGAWLFTALTVYSVSLSALLLVAIAIVGLIVYHRRRQPRQNPTMEYSRL